MWQEVTPFALQEPRRLPRRDTSGVSGAYAFSFTLRGPCPSAKQAESPDSAADFSKHVPETATFASCPSASVPSSRRRPGRLSEDTERDLSSERVSKSGAGFLIRRRRER